jgi:hypothetical protein
MAARKEDEKTPSDSFVQGVKQSRHLYRVTEAKERAGTQDPHDATWVMTVGKLAAHFLD